MTCRAPSVNRSNTGVPPCRGWLASRRVCHGNERRGEDNSQASDKGANVGLEIDVAEYDEGGGHRAASLRLGIGASVSLSVTRSQRPSIVALFATVGSPT